MSQLLDYLVENEPGFRRARLPALYSDFQSQRTLNPDGYQANVSAWRRALSRLVRSGLAPSPRGATPSLLVLNSNEQLLRALETKQYGRPLAVGTVVREALAAKDLVPLSEFLNAKESIYHRPWSVWGLAAWTMKQLGVADYLRSEKLPVGEFVVVANAEEVGKLFGDRSEAAASRFERTFSKTHFYKTFNSQLVEGKQLSQTDIGVLLKFLSRDKGVVLYDGETVKIKAPGQDNQTAITEEDASIAQLKEMLEYLTHQTALLSTRVDELTTTAKEAVAKKNRVAALAALKSKKLAETTLERRFTTVSQLEEVAAKIEQASDNLQLVKVMEASGEALRTLHAQVGGAERVEEVVDRLREQMSAADEVNSILAESAGAVVDEAEIDDELAALEAEEKAKVAEAERKKAEAEKARRDAEMAREAEETRRRLEAIEKIAAETQKQEQAETQEAEALMSRMSLEEMVPERQREEPQAAV
ncbi:Snf7-domain-containing protein [Lasiosphaeris hirsuta]|uniref:Snf7-domain-containing protein n=1 Tax=Lasiosphaeris hirsuta TaxID=260670 RepID=A0AA40AFD0_9PEZI|nr:Snf7-domain-containing protein [Lasiosphaeris hirsuta]